MGIRSKKIKFEELNVEAPIIKIKTSDGTECYAVVDTGSEQTVFDSTFYNKHRKCFTLCKDECQISVIGIGGQSNLMPLKLISGFVTLGDVHTALVSGMISDLEMLTIHLKIKNDITCPVAMIIGYDMLSKMNAVIDVRKKCMEVQ